MQPLFHVCSRDFDFYVRAKTEVGACAQIRALPHPSSPGELKAKQLSGKEPYGSTEHYKDSVVGHTFRGWGSNTYLCTAYDSRIGYWMQNVKTGEMRDVSERAIDRVYRKQRN